MILALIHLACVPTINSAPYAGVVTALDTNQDRRIDATEYDAAAAPVAPPFAEVDLDGDGALSRDEAAGLARRVDPANYDPKLNPSQAAARRQQGAPPKSPKAGDERAVTGRGSGFDGSGPPLIGGAHDDEMSPPKPDHRPAGLRGPGVAAPTVGNTDAKAHDAELFREAVQFEAEEVLARAPAGVVPSERELRVAVDAGAGSVERRDLLTALRAEVERVGLTWPPSLTP